MAALKSRSVLTWLQWGHGISAVDTTWEKLNTVEDMLASMGPRHFSRGYHSFPVMSQSPSRLQWGHGISAVDTIEQSFLYKYDGTLQWGHGISAVDTQLPRPVEVQDPQLQWGHGISAVDTSGARSNNAAITPLQWGHGISAVDTVHPIYLIFMPFTEAFCERFLSWDDLLLILFLNEVLISYIFFFPILFREVSGTLLIKGPLDPIWQQVLDNLRFSGYNFS